MPKVLLTNDDGIHADGIKALEKAFVELTDWEVVVIAPDRERSGAGHSVTFDLPIRTEEIVMEGNDITHIAVNGTPSDCTKLAIQVLLEEHKPDIVVSGINKGPNLGTDVLYSGTVSAAIEAVLQGIPAIALSIVDYYDLDYAYTAELGVDLARHALNHPLPPRTVINVNTPHLSASELKGIKVTKLAFIEYENPFSKQQDAFGRTYYWLAGEIAERDLDDDDDLKAVRDGYVSITPLHFDLTNHRLMKQLEAWHLKLPKIQ